MSHINIWIHAVWATKRRAKILPPDQRHMICEHIRQNARQKKIFILEINGYLDHLHCLMALKADWSIAKQMQMIKGEASHWINANKIFSHKFDWANEYYAGSVSKSNLDRVRNYIRLQEEHHRKQSFEEEYATFLKTLDGSAS